MSVIPSLPNHKYKMLRFLRTSGSADIVYAYFLPISLQLPASFIPPIGNQYSSKSTFLADFSQPRIKNFQFRSRYTRERVRTALRYNRRGRSNGQLNIHCAGSGRGVVRGHQSGIDESLSRTYPVSLRARNRSSSAAEFQVAACYSGHRSYETNLRRL